MIMVELKYVAVFVFVTAYFVGKILGTDPDPEVCLVSFHFTDPEFTCCGNKRYPPPPLQNHSSDCLNRVSEDEKLISSSWRTYECIINGLLRKSGKSLNLEAFAEIMTNQFSPEIQGNIMALVRKKGQLMEIDYGGKVPSEFQELMQIRYTYYQIEKQVCKMLAGNGDSGMDDPPKRCYNWMERYHGAGDCCANTPIPFQLSPEPYYSSWAITNYTATTIMSMVGKYDWYNWTYSNNLAQCFKTARLLRSKVISFDLFKSDVLNMTELNYKVISRTLIPKFIPGAIQNAMIEYMTLNITQNPTIKQLADYPVEQHISTYEFKWYNSNRTRFLYWRCEAHRILSVRMKDYDITEKC